MKIATFRAKIWLEKIKWTYASPVRMMTVRGLGKIQKKKKKILCYFTQGNTLMWLVTFFFMFIEKIKARKKPLIQNEGTMSEERKTELASTAIVFTVILTGTHFWELEPQDFEDHHPSQKQTTCVYACVLLPNYPW